MHIKLKKLEASGWMDGWEGEKAAFEEAVQLAVTTMYTKKSRNSLNLQYELK